MTRPIGRRDFFRSGTGLLTTGMAPYPLVGKSAAPVSEPANQEGASGYKVKWYEFTEH